MKPLKIILVTEDAGTQHLGIMHLVSVLKNNNFNNVEVVQAIPELLLSKINDNERTIIGYSTFTVLFQYYFELNKYLKKHKEFFAVFGGSHPTFYPDIINLEGIDGICIGEGEFALLDFVRAYEKGGDITNIKNWHVKLDNKIYKNPVRPLVKNMDELPYPDRSYYSNSRPTFMSSRGCPYKCSYCFNSAFNKIYDNKNIIRRRTVPNLISEIKQVIKSNNTDFIKFEDDIFIMSKPWLREFSKMYKEQINIPFICYVRANLVDEEVIKLLKHAGCHSVAMGIEAGNEKVRKEILFRDITNETMISACHQFRAVGIKVRTYNIVGIGGTTLSNDFETLQLNRQCKPHHASCFLMVPYPGTVINDRAKKQGQFDDDFSESLKVNRKLQIDINDKKYKRKVQNFHKLFPLAVEFSIINLLLKILICIPNNRFFDRSYDIWNRYCYNFRILPSSLRSFKRYRRLFRVSFNNSEKYLKQLKKESA